MKHDFSRQIFEKPSNTKFYENPPSRNRVFECEQTDGRTERHDESNSRFSQFCQRVERENRTVDLLGIWTCASVLHSTAQRIKARVDVNIHNVWPTY